jgi:hypothetical protein
MDPDRRPTCEQLLQLPYFVGAASWFTPEFHGHQVLLFNTTTMCLQLPMHDSEYSEYPTIWHTLTKVLDPPLSSDVRRTVRMVCPSQSKSDDV